MGLKERVKFIARAHLNAFLDSFKERGTWSLGRSDPGGRFVGDETDNNDEEIKISDEEFERRWAEFQEEQMRSRARKEWESDSPPRRRSGERSISQCYLNLECPVGADLKTARTHFRKMMKKYHPDLHSGNARNLEAANRISQIITECYRQLEKHLQAKGQR